MSGSRIYLDYAATTPCRPEVVDAMLPLLARDGYNAGSIHADGRRARAALDASRARVAALLGATAREIVFTASGSEANALAVCGVARALRERGRHLVTAATEHHAVLRAMEALRDDGWAVTILGVDRHGRVDSEHFRAALRADTVLASIMLANNEIGTLSPIQELARISHDHGVLFHTDAVQAPGQLRTRIDELGVDLLSLSAHKFYGPKGVGALYVRSGTPVIPLVHGGGQEFGLRSGTENVAGIVGLATALDLAIAELSDTAARLGSLRDRFEARVQSAIPNAVIFGVDAPRLPNISNVGFPGADAQALLVRLDLDGISASAGSACTAGSLEPSHVIAALCGADSAPATLRFSLGRETTEAELESVASRLPGIVASACEFPAFVGTT